MGSGLVIVSSAGEGTGSSRKELSANAKDQLFSQHLACMNCGISYDEPAPNSFSFNSPYGSCPACSGLGEMKEFDMNLIFPDESLSINQEGIAPLGKPRDTWFWNQVRAVVKKFDVDLDAPVKKMPKKTRDILLYGAGEEKFEVPYVYSSGRTVVYKHRFNGLIDMLKHYYDETSSEGIRQWVESFMTTKPCETCKGGRLRKESLAVKLTDAATNEAVNIHDVVKLSIKNAVDFFDKLHLTDRQLAIAHQVLKEIKQRLKFLLNVGLNYLSLDRSARTLSGGEGQRIRLATQIGSQLVGVLYILDEPSIGLHQRDNIKLIDSLKGLRDLGNTVIVVEHDKEMIQSADFVVDLGPGAGEHGGYIVTAGKPNQLKVKNDELKIPGNGVGVTSHTGMYLSGKKAIEVPSARRKGNGKYLVQI